MILLVLTLTLLPIFILMIFMPYWTRRTESFGVSIPEDLYHSEALITMRKKYAVSMTYVSLITLAIVVITYFFLSDETVLSLVYSFIVLAYLVINFIVYLNYHKQMKIKKQTEKWDEQHPQQFVINVKFHEQPLTLSNWLYAFPFLLTMVMIMMSFYWYDRIPDKIPMHYNFFGEVTRWADKSFGTVLFLPLTQFFLVIIMFIVHIAMQKAKQQVSAKNPEESMQRNIIFRRRWSIFLFVTTVATTILFTVIQANLIFNISETLILWLSLFISFGIIIYAIILSITTGQGGSRLKIKTGKDQPVIDRDDDQYWKLGQFYFNKNDPAIFLEKRFGIGWTVNWARPSAWIFLIGTILLALLPFLFI